MLNAVHVLVVYLWYNVGVHVHVHVRVCVHVHVHVRLLMTGPSEGFIVRAMYM